jgi:hypothetical protein
MISRQKIKVRCEAHVKQKDKRHQNGKGQNPLFAKDIGELFFMPVALPPLCLSFHGLFFNPSLPLLPLLLLLLLLLLFPSSGSPSPSP